MASSKVHVFNELNFEDQVLNATGPVLVDFTAVWCGPCKLQAAVLDQVAERLDHVRFGQVDVDGSPELAARYGIRAMPTLVVFSAGRETGRRLGIANEQRIRALLPANDRSGNFPAGVVSTP